MFTFVAFSYDFKGMIDYMFFSRNLLRTVGLLGPLDIDWIRNNRIVGFPHPHVPSDHLPLMVELELFNPSHNANNNGNNYGYNNMHNFVSMNNNSNSNNSNSRSNQFGNSSQSNGTSSNNNSNFSYLHSNMRK